MSNTAIRVENLSKKYIISHQRRERYVALRDVLTSGMQNLGRRLQKPFNRKLDKLDREDFWALKDVSFEVKQGERVGIIGRNGAGKSTLLKILSRITEPSTGRISIRGRVGTLLEVGTGFHPELTGRENIYLNGAILGMKNSAIKKKFDEIVSFADVEKFLDTPVKYYSSGMYVRLAFSVAAHLEPDILIVDEVLAVGDAVFQKKCLGKIEEASGQEGRTVLLVSHNMGIVNQLCTSSIWLEAGTVKAIGEPYKLTERYLETSYNSQSFVEFTLQPNKKGQIISVKLTNKNNVSTSDFACGEEVTVEIGFALNTSVKGCHIACIVSTSEGYHLFSTADTDTNPDLFEKRLPGKYIVQVKLPTTSLNTGIYHIAVSLGIPGIEGFDRQNALSFTLNDTGDFGTMKEGSRRAGLLLVKIPWDYV